MQHSKHLSKSTSNRQEVLERSAKLSELQKDFEGFLNVRKEEKNKIAITCLCGELHMAIVRKVRSLEDFQCIEADKISDRL